MKKNLLKRILAASLAVTMTTSLPAVTQAAGRAMLTASAAVNAPVMVVDSGICGDTATYTLDSTGKLTILGSGAVSENAFAGGIYAYADSVTAIEFEAGSAITALGANSFNGLTGLQTVTLAPSIELIADSAFYSCSALSSVHIASTNVSIADSAFGSCGALASVDIASTFVKLHPDAFSGSTGIEALAFTALDGTTIQGALYGLPETAEVTVMPFSKIYSPAGKYFTGSSVAYDTYQPQFDHAQLYWEDTEPIIEAAQADEAGVRISDKRESLEWITNDNIAGLFTDAQCAVVGTMEGDGSFENPYLIWDTPNWRYLDFLARLGKLSSSYYGWDRGTNVKLMADLTLSDQDNTFTTIGGGKHKEVHNNDYVYCGNFDGNGHTITLDVNASVDDNEVGFGLFERTGGAYIKNLHISGRMVSSETNTGLLVGYASSHDRIINCSSDAVLVLEGSGEMKSGAFVGYSYRTYLENCHFTGKIIGGDEITAVGGFVGELSSSSGGSTLINCYFAPSKIDVSSSGSCILYRPYYGSYYGWCGFETCDNNYYNAEALKLNGENMGDLDQGTSDSAGIASLNETEFWDNGQLTMPKATAEANPGTRNFVYTGGEHRIFMDLQADAYHYPSENCISRGDSFPYMPGYAHNGIAQYKVNDGEWSTTPPLATEAGEYTVYYRAAGDAYHRDSDIQSIQVTIAEPQELPGSGTPADPYTISNDLEWSIFCDMRDTTGKYFKLVNDITVSEDRESKRGPNHPLEFNGVFDGDGHKITLYYVSRGTSDSLFGRLYGKWSYDISSYNQVCVKNLIVDGVMYTGGGNNAPIAHTIGQNAIVSNIISNMTIVNINAGGEQNVSGIVVTGDLGEAGKSGSYFYNCKVGGKFSAAGGNKTFAGLTYMNDFWKSGTGFLVKDSYVNPVCEDIKVSDGNSVILKNHVEGKSTIENTFYGQSILSIIPVDEETGETTNTQGISDENGLDALYATGYWANGCPTMPRATVTKAAEKTTFLYAEEEAVVLNEETGEEETVMQAVSYPLIEEQTAQGGTVWYSVNGGAWSTDIPTACEAGRYTVRYKAVGDCLHRDSETGTAVVGIVYDWMTPTDVTAALSSLPFDDYGALTSGADGRILVSWNADERVEQCAVTVDVITQNGEKGTLISSAPVMREYWYELSAEKPTAAFFLPLLGTNDTQVFENGRVNGVKYGDNVVVSAAGIITAENGKIESFPSAGTDFTAGISNTGKRFPVLEEGMSNDSELLENEIVKGEYAVVEALASGGKAPYQYEVKYKRTTQTSYTTAQAYGKNQIVRFKPAGAVTYDVLVSAKDADGNVVSKSFTLTVNKTLENRSVISENEIVSGETATIRASAADGLRPYRYEVLYRASDDENYTTVQEYSTNTAINLALPQGEYEVLVNVQDARGKTVGKTFALKVNKPLENRTQLSEEQIVIGDSIQLDGSAEGGLAPYQYEVSCKNAGSDTYTTVQAYSTNGSITVTPSAVGECQIHINIKDARGTVVGKDLTVTVNELLANTSVLSENKIVVGESVQVLASAEGGIAPYQYEVLYKKASGSVYYTARAYGTDPVINVKPAAATVYDIRVNVKDARGIIATKDMTVRVNKVLSNSSFISENEIVIGESIEITAAAQNGLAPYEYEIAVKAADDADFAVISAYSANTHVTFTPDTASGYTVRVNVKDARGTAVSKEFSLKVNKALENLSSIDRQQIITGDTAVITLHADGGLKPYEYEVSCKPADADSYTVVQAYADVQTAEIAPAVSGVYSIKVNARDARGTIRSKEFTLTVNEPLSNTSSLSDSVIVIGDTIAVTASSEGGIAPCSYEIAVSKAGGSYTVLREYSDSTSEAYTPDTTGSYTVRVRAKDAMGTIVSKEMSFRVNELLKNLSDISDEVIMLSDYTTVSADAQGGVAPYQYKAEYKTATGSYTTVQDYSTNRTVNIEPTEAGQCTVRMSIMDARGNVSEKEFPLDVRGILENTSTISAEMIAPGSTVTVSASAQNGVGSCQYAVYYKPETESVWKKAQGYKSNTQVKIRLYDEGEYDICTKVLDSFGTVASKYFAVTVAQMPLTNTSSTVSESIELGNALIINCSSTGGKGEVQYAVYYKADTSSRWLSVQDFSTTDTASLTFDTEGRYNICVKAKDSEGTVDKLYLNVDAVTPALRNTSSISADSVPLGDTLTVNCSSTGGKGEVQYAVYYKADTSSKWLTVQNFSVTAMAALTFDTEGKYNICVKAKDSEGTTAKIYFDVVSAPAPFRNTSSVAAENGTITINCSSTGSDGEVQYAVYYKLKTSSRWLTAQNFSSLDVLTLTPASGSYDLCIKAKNSDGTIEKCYAEAVI